MKRIKNGRRHGKGNDDNRNGSVSRRKFFEYTDSQKSCSVSLFPAVRPLLWARFVILGAVLGFAAYVPRSWCKYFCPHGAILAFLNRFSFLGLTRDPLKCTKAGCNDCVQACPMNVPILDLPWEKFTHPECIYCLKCADACTTKAIKPKIP